MNNNKLSFLKNINFNLLDENYEMDIEVNGNVIDLDLNFRNKRINNTKIENLKEFLTHLELINKSCIVKYNNDFKNNGVAFNYIQFHKEEMDLEDSINNPLIDNIELIRIGLYPSEEIPFFAVFDYSLCGAFGMSNQLLVVLCDSKGNPIEVTWES